MIFMMPKFGRNIRPKSKIWKSLLYDITFNISFWEYLPRISFFSCNELLSIGSSRQKRKNVEDINFLKVDPLDFQSILSWPPPGIFSFFFRIDPHGNPCFFLQNLAYLPGISTFPLPLWNILNIGGFEFFLERFMLYMLYFWNQQRLGFLAIYKILVTK